MSLSTTQYGYIVDPMVPFTDDKGKTIKNGFIRVFMAGTSTPVLTYRNYDGATNQEKIELDNSGRVKHNVIGSKGSLYKVVVYDAHHSQETPILTVDKIAVLGASVTATTVVTGLDSVTVQEENFLKATVEGTGVELALDPTEVTSEVSTIGSAETAAPDYVVPLLDKTGEGDSKKISLANLFKFTLDWISRLATTITSFASGDFIAISNTTNGARKMAASRLLELTAQNALGSIKSLATTKYKGFMALDDADGTGKMDVDTIFNNFATKFIPNSTNAVKGLLYTYDGIFYKAKEDYIGDWDESKFKKITIDELVKTFAEKSVVESNKLQLNGLPYFMWNKAGVSFAGNGGDVEEYSRNLIEFNFKQGVTYKISIVLSGYVQRANPAYAGFFVSTTNDTFIPSTNPVDYITPSSGFLSGDVENKTYDFIFTASADAKNLNIFLGAGDGNWSYVVSIYDCAKYFPDKKLLNEIFTETFVNDDNVGGTKRFYSSFPMKAGAKYFFEVDLSGDFYGDQGLDLFDLNTNGAESTTSVVESVFKIEFGGTHNSGKYVFEFTPTKNTNYIYIYSHKSVLSGTLTGAIKVYSILENGVKPDEGVLIYGIGDSLMVYGWFMEHLRDKYGFKYLSYAQGSTGYATNNNDPSKNTYPQRVLTMPNDAPALVLVEGGTNDFGKNKTIAEVKEAVEDTIENLYTKYPTTPIVGVLPSQRYYSGSAQSPHGMVNDIGVNLIDYVDAIKEIYDKYGFPTIDLCRDCGLNELNAPDLTIDGLHWNEDFHKRIAEIIYPVLKKMYVR